MKQFFILICASFLVLATYGQEVIEVTFDSFADNPYYTPADTTVSRRTGETIITPANWLVLLENESYSFTFNYYSEELVGNYSIEGEDFLLDFTNGYDKQVEPYAKRINFESCVLTITQTRPSATVTRYLLEANIVDSDDKHYHVTATHDVLTATEVVEAEILDAQINPTDYGFVLVAKDDALQLDINLSIKWAYGVAGYFRNYHVDSVNTVITHQGKSFIPSELEMEVAYNEALSSGKMGYSIQAMQFLSPDVVAYNLKIEAPIIFTDTIDIICTNLVWDESQKSEGAIMFEASNSTYNVFGVLSTESLKKGVYDAEKASIEIVDIANETTINPLKNTVTVDGNILKGFTATAEVLGSNHKVYQLNLTKQNNPTDVQDIHMNEDACKTIKDGQLIIIKNGVRYSILGNVLR